MGEPTLDEVLVRIVDAGTVAAVSPIFAKIEALQTEFASVRQELAALRNAMNALSAREKDSVYLSAKEVATRLSVSLRSVKRWIADGTLPHVRLPGGGVRVSAVEVESMLRRVTMSRKQPEAAE